eukprot:2695788-Prymnesium_polylepis.1
MMRSRTPRAPPRGVPGTSEETPRLKNIDRPFDSELSRTRSLSRTLAASRGLSRPSRSRSRPLVAFYGLSRPLAASRAASCGLSRTLADIR